MLTKQAMERCNKQIYVMIAEDYGSELAEKVLSENKENTHKHGELYCNDSRCK